MESKTPFSSYWGEVRKPHLDQKVRGDVLVTIAGIELRFERKEGDGLAELGLLRPTKKHTVIFIVTDIIESTSKNRALIGWRNPPSIFVRTIQASILTPSLSSLYAEMNQIRPLWKSSELKDILLEKAC